MGKYREIHESGVIAMIDGATQAMHCLGVKLRNIDSDERGVAALVTVVGRVGFGSALRDIVTAGHPRTIRIVFQGPEGSWTPLEFVVGMAKPARYRLMPFSEVAHVFNQGAEAFAIEAVDFEGESWGINEHE